MTSYNGFSPAERYKALAWIKREWAEGRRARPTACEVCGQTAGIVDAHSEDYSFPFGAHIGKHSLCYRCHMMVHCRFKNRPAWLAYREQMREGWRFAAVHTRNFQRFAAEHLGAQGSGVAHTRHAPRGRTFLDDLQ